MSAEQTLRPSNEPDATKKEHPRHDLEMVRAFAREAGITRVVSDEDASAVLDWFHSDPDPEYRSLPDMEWDSPEFWAEIRRRSDRKGPVLSAKTVDEQLHLRWGQNGA
jgi:hypothetical protein